MLKWSKIVAMIAAIFVAVGCEADGGTEVKGGVYGTLQVGEEQIPINFAKITETDSWMLVTLSPLTDALNLTTNAIIGVNTELLGEELDVERYYCNDDYIVVYEDPQCYYAPFRPLKSGKIVMRKSGNVVGVDVDVVLFDGTPLRYTCWELPK